MEEIFARTFDPELVAVSEELKFHWPELLPVERIRAGITEIAFGLIVFGALVVFCWFK